MKTIYIAGPFRAPTAWEIEYNIRNAEHWGLVIARLGAVPVIPHTMYRFFHGTLPDEFWIEATLMLLRPCNGVFVIDYEHAALEQWRKSKGTLGEVAEARRLGRPVFFREGIDDRSLATWIKEGT